VAIGPARRPRQRKVTADARISPSHRLKGLSGWFSKTQRTPKQIGQSFTFLIRESARGPGFVKCRLFLLNEFRHGHLIIVGSARAQDI
jgi:hypothetical protein